MGRIQSTIGLFSGVPITDTVDQLIAVSARPRDLVAARNAQLEAQQLAFGELTSRVLALQLTTNALGKEEAFTAKSVRSHNEDLLSATAIGDPALGRFAFTPVRSSQNHQLLTSGFASLDEPLSAGTLSLRLGGQIDPGVEVAELNDGNGVDRGQIRITDRLGASAVIDLRFVQTIDDVLEAINTNSEIGVTATTSGDSIQLVDGTGGSVSNLRVEEFGSGTAAASLGLAGIDVAANQATGLDVLHLHEDLRLGQLNDGLGVRLRSELADLTISFRDGSTPLSIDLNPADEDALSAAPRTLGDLLDAINAADPTRLVAQIATGGEHIEWIDLTSGGGTFSVTSTLGGTTAEDLGIDGPAVAGVIAGRRIQSGLKTTLLSSLSGGSGLGPMGTVQLTDRSGAVANVDLSAAVTVEDIVRSINASGVGIEARVNDPHNGLLLIDTSGSTSGNLIVSNVDATNSADRLQIAIDDAVSLVDSGPLNRQVISENTQLDVLNGGRGVSLGSFFIADTAGDIGAVNLAMLEATTVGDVIDAINGLSIGVSAGINRAGDGIWLVDTADGSQTLEVREAGTGSTAADLNLLGPAVETDVLGTLRPVIDGTTTAVIDISSEDTVGALIDRINSSNIGVIATAVNTGSGSTPYRIALISQTAGRLGQMVVDTRSAGFEVQEIAPAQDALLLFGSAESSGVGVLIASATNAFDSVLDGVELVLEDTSDNPVTVDIETTDSTLIDSANAFVDAFNQVRDKLDELTFFNEVDNSRGILFGTSEALRVETDLTRLATDRFFGVGKFESLAVLGMRIDESGRMNLDSERLQAAFADDPVSVTRIFTDEDLGVAAKFNSLIESLAGAGDSVLSNRSTTLADRIDANRDRIDFLNLRLEAERERLLLDFFRMEQIIGNLQNSLAAIESLQQSFVSV